ncbi:hypothetical protein, partial [Bifidobacterium bombi]
MTDRSADGKRPGDRITVYAADTYRFVGVRESTGATVASDGSSVEVVLGDQPRTVTIVTAGGPALGLGGDGGSINGVVGRNRGVAGAARLFGFVPSGSAPGAQSLSRNTQVPPRDVQKSRPAPRKKSRLNNRQCVAWLDAGG